MAIKEALGNTFTWKSSLQAGSLPAWSRWWPEARIWTVSFDPFNRAEDASWGCLDALCTLPFCPIWDGRPWYTLLTSHSESASLKENPVWKDAVSPFRESLTLVSSLSSRPWACCSSALCISSSICKLQTVTVYYFLLGFVEKQRRIIGKGTWWKSSVCVLTIYGKMHWVCVPQVIQHLPWQVYTSRCLFSL